MQTWTTTHHPAREQFSYWREVLCAAFAPLRPERERSHGPRPDGGITSVVRSAPLGSSMCADVRSTTQRIVHGPAEIRATDEDVVFVNLQLGGHCLAEQDGRRTIVSPGQYAVFDTSTQYRFEYVGDGDTDEWRVLCFRIPRTQLVPLVPDLRGVTCVGIDTTQGTGAIVRSSMTSAWHHIDTVADPGAVQSAFVTVLAAQLGSAGNAPSARAQVGEATRAAVNRYVDANLRSVDLRPAAVAARFGISVRTLHGLYQDSGKSYGRTVMSLRLAHCARALTDPDDQRSITQLATDLGFADLSHLDRSFSREYGKRPRDVRRHCRP